jgi:hypothetical protein
MCGDVPSGYVVMFALFTWSASGRPPPTIAAPSMFCASTRSSPSKFPAASSNSIPAAVARWSWKVPTDQWSCTASALRFVFHEPAELGFQRHEGGTHEGGTDASAYVQFPPPDWPISPFVDVVAGTSSPGTCTSSRVSENVCADGPSSVVAEGSR